MRSKSFGSMIALAVVRLLTKEDAARAQDYKDAWLNVGKGSGTLSGGLAETPVYCAQYLGGGSGQGASGQGGSGLGSSGSQLPWLSGSGSGGTLGGNGAGSTYTACVASNNDLPPSYASCAASATDPEPSYTSCVARYTPDPEPKGSGGQGGLPSGFDPDPGYYYGGLGGNLKVPPGLGGFGGGNPSNTVSCAATISTDPQTSAACVANNDDPAPTSVACVATLGNNGASSLVACADQGGITGGSQQFSWEELGGGSAGASGTEAAPEKSQDAP